MLLHEYKMGEWMNNKKSERESTRRTEERRKEELTARDKEGRKVERESK